MSFKPFIVDFSVTISWFLEDEKNEYSKFTLDYCTQFEAIVPHIWEIEVANTLLIAEKRARISTADTVRILEFLNSLPINISKFTFPMHEVINTARANNLTTNDTTYLLAAMHEGLPLATNNKALIKHVIITVFRY